jgi:uncharacterized protein YgiM (DUF1202 family)
MKGFVLSIIIAFSLIFPLLISQSAHAASTLYVTSANAELKIDANASASTVSQLSIGTRLSVITSKGKWYKVSAPSGETGWIYRGKVSTSPPSDDSGGLFGSSSGSSIELSKADTARSIRGLSPEAKEYADNANVSQAAQQALDNVLSMRVSDYEIDQFLKDGRVGEYAP